MSNKTSNQSHEYDLSVKHLPESWLQAEVDSPTNQNVTSLTVSERKLIMPTGQRTSPLNVFLSAVLGAFVFGLAWYLLSWFGAYTGPWTAVAVGVAIALIVRIACGPGDIPVRALSSLLAYLTAVIVVLVALTWNDVTGIYGSVEFGTYEEFLVQNHVKQLDRVAAYALGALASVQVSYLLRHR